MRRLVIIVLLFSISNTVFSQYPPKEIVLGSSPYTRVEDTIKRSGIFVFNDEEIETYRSDYYINSAPMGTKAQLNDENGELVLFTDGANIYNRNGERIENGDSLSLTSRFLDGLFSLNFGADLENFTLFLDYPGESDKYFLIHTARNYPKTFSDKFFGNIVDSVFYSVIDMGNGPGEVTKKNVEFMYEENMAYGWHTSPIRHANGRDWWIIMSEVLTGNFKIYLLSPEGITLHHIEHHSSHKSQVSFTSAFNSDGSEFVIHSRDVLPDTSLNLNIDLYDFDRCNGSLVHQQSFTTHFPYPPFISGMDLIFSESDRFLYVCNGGQELYQFDRENGGDQWLDEPVVVGELREEDWKNRQLPPKALSNLFMSPTGELYIMFGATSDALNIVKRPERKGLNSKFELDGVLLHEHKDSFYFQSSFPHFPNMTAGPIDGSSCDTLGINNEVVAKYRNYRSTDRISEIDFYDVSYFNPTEWEWDFGDGQTSSLENPSHRYAASGTFTVCLTARNAFSEDTYCKDITIEETNSNAEFDEGNFMVYPNPAEDILYIETSGDRYNIAEIVDVSGQTVRRIRLTSGTNRTEVALDDIPQGLYFLKINDETKKFVKL